MLTIEAAAIILPPTRPSRASTYRRISFHLSIRAYAEGGRLTITPALTGMQQQKVRLGTRATIMMLVDGMFSGKVYRNLRTEINSGIADN
jgi:hypothetical protein